MTYGIYHRVDLDAAWENHKRVNAHHWENWTQKKDHQYADIFLVEMICDWVAMGFEFGGTAKDYYEKNKDKINIPDWAEFGIYKIFDCIYPEQ